jgi:hypothetical protein
MSHVSRRILSVASLLLATLVFVLRVREINKPAPPVRLAPRTLHLLYLDSLRQELLTFAEQYGRPVFQYDTTSPVTGHGRIQLARLRRALFDPRVEYAFSDEGFAIEWRTDPKPHLPSSFVHFGAPGSNLFRKSIANAWPESAAEYARIRRLIITPQWPEPPQRRTNRPPARTVPPHGDVFATSH